MYVMAGLYLAIGVLLGFFLRSQVLVNGLSLAAPDAGDAVTLITALFLAHIIAGIIYLIRFGSLVYRNTSDMVKSLLFFTDSIQVTRLRLLAVFWHYTTISWLFFYFVLLFTN